MDEKLTLNAIGSLLDALSAATSQIERLQIFSTIKVLCSLLETRAKYDETWQGYMDEKFNNLLHACGCVAGLSETHESWITHLAYAGTALSNLKSQACFNVE